VQRRLKLKDQELPFHYVASSPTSSIMASSSFSRRVPSSLLNPQLQSRAAASIARKRSRSAVGAIAAPPYAAHLPRLLAARYVGIQLGAQNLVQTPARLYSSNASPISSGAADMFHGLARLDQTPARLFSSNASPTSTGAADMFHGLARLDQTLLSTQLQLQRSC
jgi:hypothetical protein